MSNFLLVALSPPLFDFPISALSLAFSLRLVMGARGEVGAGVGGQCGPGSGGLGWLGSGGLLWAFGRWVRRAGVAGRAVSPRAAVPGSPASPDGRARDAGLGGDGALGWVAGERPCIISLLLTPPPLSGFLSFSSPLAVSFFLFSSLAPLSSLPYLFFPPPLVSLSPFPLKRKGDGL